MEICYVETDAHVISQRNSLSIVFLVKTSFEAGGGSETLSATSPADGTWGSQPRPSKTNGSSCERRSKAKCEF